MTRHDQELLAKAHEIFWENAISVGPLCKAYGLSHERWPHNQSLADYLKTGKSPRQQTPATPPKIKAMHTLETIQADRRDVLKKLSHVNAANLRQSIHDPESLRAKRGRFSCTGVCRTLQQRSLAPDLDAFAPTELTAADNVDANEGTLSGTLVSQRTLELFRIKYPLISRVLHGFFFGTWLLWPND